MNDPSIFTITYATNCMTSLPPPSTMSITEVQNNIFDSTVWQTWQLIMDTCEVQIPACSKIVLSQEPKMVPGYIYLNWLHLMKRIWIGYLCR